MNGTERTVGRFRCIEVEAKSALTRVRGMPWDWSLNPYRGCWHQCVFCYARRTHTFLERDGTSDWGAALYAKINLPERLRAELSRPSWRGDEVHIGTATDPYQPLEGQYRLTRRCLQEFARARTPVSLITRSPLVVRDSDVLAELAEKAGAVVTISLPTLDADLARRLEPTVAPPRKRLFAVQSLAARGIRVGIAVAPIVPQLTDTSDTFAAIMRAARDVGASFVWPSVLNLNEVARESFFRFLEQHEPQRLADFRAIYRGTYAPKATVAPIHERFRIERGRIVLQPPPAIDPAPPQQTALFGGR